MAFCVQCGAQVDAKFCQACGAVNPAFSGGAAAGAPPTPGPMGAAPATGGLTENTAGALCYLLGLITGILFLVLAPYNQNRTIRFHAFQSIFFNLAWIAFWMVMGVVLGMMKVFAFLLLPLYPLVGLGGFCLWIYLMWRAYNNQPLVLPVVGPLAQQQASSM